ncbi:MAG: 4-alpha-glucanotransferase [Ignavibacteria bacterium]|nr:4-alpha-glucanotransferase [Ignavibacteria bacterium]
MSFKRSAGILLHPTSLPSKYGIGDFGKAAYDFVNFLEVAGQTYWQVLPLNPTGYGESPYQSPSAFAGNTLMISIDKLVEAGLIPKSKTENVPNFNPVKIDFDAVIEYKTKIFREAYEFFKKITESSMQNAFKKFCRAEKKWLDDFAFFMALKQHFDDEVWTEWDKDIANRTPKAMKLWSKKLSDEINFHKFMQFIFFNQWNELKSYANKKGIEIIGDLPIFVSFDSADVWANRELFKLDKDGNPTVVAGVPPDYFSKTGQLWGNPHYDWKRMEKDGYLWWRERVQALLKIVDVIRIDHFRGFYNYWEIPADAPTAETGKWVKGPAQKFFRTIEKHLGKLPIIAEDLGILVPQVYQLRDQFNFPGMNILQFAFGTKGEKRFLPHNHRKNSVVYTGTHDNDTTLGWWKSIQHDDSGIKEHFLKYTNSTGKDVCWDMIKLAYSSVADIVIIPLQDFLRLDSDARMNYPSTLGGNWAWRFEWKQVPWELNQQIKELAVLYERAENNNNF